MKPDDDETEAFVPVPKNFAAHHLLWLNCLQKVEDGEIKRLMGLMPPGSAKSTFTSVVFPTHYLGRFPSTSLIVASYATDLPRKFGRKARSIVKQPIYRRIFNADLSPESMAADEWSLTNGSEWMAAGILTGITGNRVDGVIWDDLIKGREQADSELIRNKTWDAYFDDLLTRKKPHGWEVAITTRWHEDDPAGRILPLTWQGESGHVKGRDGNDWYVVCLPAEANRADDPLGREIGELLWPNWFSEEHFAPYRRSPRTWSALFQQRPAPEAGDFFKDEYLKPYEREIVDGYPLPKGIALDMLTIYGASDYAVSDKEGDYTVHVVVGVDKDDKIYLLDLWRKQASSDVWVETQCDLIKIWRPMGWAEESGQIRAGVGPFLTKRLRERQLYIARAGFASRSNKAVRAQSIRARMAMGFFYVPHGAPWYPDLRNEMMAFPTGHTDDQVDALSLIGQVLERMVSGNPKSETAEKPKVFSTHPGECTVTLTDLFEENERKKVSRTLRIS